jgi:hypothetical protein
LLISSTTGIGKYVSLGLLFKIISERHFSGSEQCLYLLVKGDILETVGYLSFSVD